ncbi:hypothetical protein GGS21DRAFT_310102 [Xylaria nigripes]|nr:hypothetical protein GGS21DRAFT_310102 [Xylaria nigripes]
MSATRPALSAAGCSQCRSLLLGLFTSSVSRSAPVIRSPLPYTHAPALALSIRGFSSLPKANNSTSHADYARNAHASEETDSDEGPVVSDEKSNDVPWYLKVEPPTHIAPIEPQPLPAIPPDSPHLIHSLLEYASEEMGLDDLNLLDLRKLDPSPALGPNLFMLFGTARSERHLHVSAGRLVRWLRAKHRVHADADGLLGPNERKTKLRRKARRAKLLGTVGTDDADDGIRTGWICVNLGTIGRGGPESAVIGEDGRVSGFGASYVGSTVVFQIMVESRRAELDLETLWTETLERSLSPSSNPDSARDEEPSRSAKSESNLDAFESAILDKIHHSNVPANRKGSYGVVSQINQARFFSTQQPSSAFDTSVDPLESLSGIKLARVLTYDVHQKQRLIELLQIQLKNMDAPTARAALCRANDSAVPSFLELTERAIHGLPPSRTWGFRLALRYKAIMSEVSGTIESDLRLLVEELRVYGIQATRQQYLQLLSCILSLMKEQSTALGLALDVISTMDQRNQPIIEGDLLVTIIEEVSKGIKTKWTHKLTDRIENLLFLPNGPCVDEFSLMRLMKVHATQSRWDLVWNIWRIPPRYLRPRSAVMYSHIFELATASKSSRICTSILNRCLQEMSSEKPSVYMNEDLRHAILKCIEVVEPRALHLAKVPIGTRGHMGKLAKKGFVKLARTIMST